MTARIYEGVVHHRRLKPVEHRLNYRVFSLLMDVDEAPAMAKRLRWFSMDRFNLFSLRQRDHGAGGHEGLGAHLRGLLAEAGAPAPRRISILFYPRMLGYAFNPLTVYYCYDANDCAQTIIYEVRNTFGGKHLYVIPVEGDGEKIKQSTDKLFHVSPFIDMNMRYDFALSAPDDDISVRIAVSDPEGLLLSASFAGRARALTDRALLSLFFRYPLMTVKVIAGIHWEAARLMAKGLKLRAGGPAPASSVTVVGRRGSGRRAA